SPAGAGATRRVSPTPDGDDNRRHCRGRTPVGGPLPAPLPSMRFWPYERMLPPAVALSPVALLAIVESNRRIVAPGCALIPVLVLPNAALWSTFRTELLSAKKPWTFDVANELLTTPCTPLVSAMPAFPLPCIWTRSRFTFNVLAPPGRARMPVWVLLLTTVSLMARLPAVR